VNGSGERPTSHARTDVDPALKRTFWVSVLEANVALMAVAVGALVAIVAGREVVGLAGLFAGVILGVDLWRRVRHRPADTT